jgi:hypothetical protein
VDYQRRPTAVGPLVPHTEPVGMPLGTLRQTYEWTRPSAGKVPWQPLLTNQLARVLELPALTSIESVPPGKPGAVVEHELPEQ